MWATTTILYLWARHLERSKTVADFAFSRFTRLFPTYWTAIAVMGMMSLAHFGDPFWPRGYLVNATMLQTFLQCPDVDIAYWRFAVELVFYFGMAILYAAGQLGRSVLVSGIWLALSAASGIAGRYVDVPGWLNTYLILPHIPFLIAGTMFYLIWKARPQRGHIAAILCAYIAAGLTGGWRKMLVAGVVFSVFGIALTGRLRLLVNPVTIWLGAISYALYLTHRNVGYEVLAALNRLGVPSTVSVALALTGLIALASAITYGVEQPALALLRGWYKRRKVGAAATETLSLCRDDLNYPMKRRTISHKAPRLVSTCLHAPRTLAALAIRHKGSCQSPLRGSTRAPPGGRYAQARPRARPPRAVADLPLYDICREAETSRFR